MLRHFNSSLIGHWKAYHSSDFSLLFFNYFTFGNYLILRVGWHGLGHWNPICAPRTLGSGTMVCDTSTQIRHFRAKRTQYYKIRYPKLSVLVWYWYQYGFQYLYWYRYEYLSGIGLSSSMEPIQGILFVKIPSIGIGIGTIQIPIPVSVSVSIYIWMHELSTWYRYRYEYSVFQYWYWYQYWYIRNISVPFALIPYWHLIIFFENHFTEEWQSRILKPLHKLTVTDRQADRGEKPLLGVELPLYPKNTYS